MRLLLMRPTLHSGCYAAAVLGTETPWAPWLVPLQDASLRLYLCIMLRLHPRIVEGVMLQLGGARFVDAWVQDFGIEVRIHMEDMAPAPISADWNPGTK